MTAAATKPRPDLKVVEAQDPLAKLREPFAPHHISKLPKPTKKQTEEVRADFKKGVRCKDCGSWHHPEVVHLDYVGHAALTDRLLDVDPTWSWEPAAFNSDGLPAFDNTGGLWIKLTICGVTRLGYGHAAMKQGADPGAREKEVIGDALRNAAMRFGAALDLWHKGDLHVADTEADSDKPAPPTLAQRSDRLESAMRRQTSADDLKAVYAKGSGLCAELSDKDPARLAELEDIYAALLRSFDPPADDFGLDGDFVPEF